MQDFGSFPTQISRFFGLGEPYVPTDPGTDQIGTWGLGHIQEDIKLHIVLGGGVNPDSSWLLDVGVWDFPHTNFEIFGCWGYIWTHGSRYMPAMHKGVGTYSRGHQIVYSIRSVALLNDI